MATIVLSALLHCNHVSAGDGIEPVHARLATANTEKGMRVFLQCAVCHVSKSGAETTIGPNLWSVVGRRVAAEPGFEYSDSLKLVGGDWDFEQLNIYLSDPKLIAPEGRMPFPGIRSVEERAQLIAYLATLSDAPIALPVAAEAIGDESVVESATNGNSEKWQGLPPGPGREDVFYRCRVCHSLMIVKQQGLSREAWEESLEWMVEEQGMSPIEDETTRDTILDYLSAHFGRD